MSDPISDEEKLEFLEEALAALKDKNNIDKFTEAIKYIGTTAVYTDEAFDKINRTLLKFVAEHGSSFPEIAGYQEKWAVFKQRWEDELQYSRDFANITSGDYKRYNDVFLWLVEDISNPQDIIDAQRALANYSVESPPPQYEGLANRFTVLRRDVAEFKTDFDQYIVDKGVELEREAITLAGEIEELEIEIERLNKLIMDATIALAVTSPFFFIGGIVSGTILAIRTNERNARQSELNGKRADLELVNKRQRALAEIKTEFDGLTPSFEIISKSLSIFADTWSSFHGQALQFSKQLENIQNPADIPKLFTREVQVAREMTEPLQIALEAYANEITRHLSINKSA